MIIRWQLSYGKVLIMASSGGAPKHPTPPNKDVGWKGMVALALVVVLGYGIRNGKDIEAWLPPFGHFKTYTSVPTVIKGDETLLLMPLPRNELEQHQREFMVSLLRDHPKEVEGPAKDIGKIFPDLFHSADGYQMISVDDASRAVYDPATAAPLRRMLSYLESMSEAYISAAVDRAEFERIWKPYVISNWLAFQNVINDMDHRCKCNYEPFKQLGRSWASSMTATATKANWPSPLSAVDVSAASR